MDKFRDNSDFGFRGIPLSCKAVSGSLINLKEFKETVKKDLGDVSRLQFLFSYECEERCYITKVSDWSSLVRVYNSVNGMVFVIGVMTTPFEIKTFDFPFFVV